MTPVTFLRSTSLAVTFLILTTASWADTEVRTFRVQVDDKPAGQVTMRIEDGKDGTTLMQSQTEISLRILLFRYTYTYQGQEVWQGGRLLRFASKSNSNGVKRAVSAQAEEGGLRVRVQGRETLKPADVWLSSYWALPAADRRNRQLAVLDTDTGEDLPPVRLHYVGTDQKTFQGRLENFHHYRIVGKQTIDIWYDEKGRMVHQDRVEQGHRTVLQLMEIKR
jgi:hypothetical protein